MQINKPGVPSGWELWCEATNKNLKEIYKEPVDKVTLGEISFPENGFKDYSELCKNLAKIYISSNKNMSTDLAGNTCLEEGFNLILENPEATKEEKTLAKLGLETGNVILTDGKKDTMRCLKAGKKIDGLIMSFEHNVNSGSRDVRSKFMEAIGNSISGATGTVLAKVYSEATGNRISYSNNIILKQGFKTILESSEATEQQKTLAKLGLKAGKASEAIVNIETFIPGKDDVRFNSLPSYNRAFEVRSKFMKAIGNSMSGSIGTILAKVYSDVVSDRDIILTPSERNFILKQGLKAILGSSEATEQQKTFAKFALEADKDVEFVGLPKGSYLKGYLVGNLRGKFMKAISEPNLISGLGTSLTDYIKDLQTGNSACKVNCIPILNYGLKAILESPEATKDQKTLAKLGLEAGKGFIKSNDGSKEATNNATRIKLSFMEAIIKSGNSEKVVEN
jgi:hypothetical protein